MRRLLPALLVAVALILTTVAPVHATELDTDLEDDGFERKPIVGLVIGGSITFGVTWVPTLLVSLIVGTVDDCSDCGRVAGVLWIPVFGPAAAAAIDDDSSSTGNILAAAATVAQAMGLTMLIFGAVGVDEPSYDARAPGLSLEMSPMVGPGTGGMSFQLRF